MTEAKEKWSDAVTHRDPATFHSSGVYKKSAKEIYLEFRNPSVSPNGIASAIWMNQFYINRAGRNLPEERKQTIREANRLLGLEKRVLDGSASEQDKAEWGQLADELGLESEPSPVHPPPPRDQWAGAAGKKRE